MRRGSVHIMNIRGIPIRLHYLFILFFPVIVWAFSRAQERTFIFSAIVYLLVFACVAMHELAHSLVAQSYGLTVREIVLYPIGGVAMLERIPEDPRKEASIASAGPLFNILMSLTLFALMKLAFRMEFDLRTPLHDLGWLEQLLLWLFFVNVIMAVFNLIPAFPMDGGRLLRAALVAAKRSYVAATVTAVRISKVILFAFLIIGLWRFNPWLLAIAFIVYSGATGEEALARTRSALGNLTARHLLPQQPIGVEPETPLGDLVPLLLNTSQRHFPVIAKGKLAGLISYPDLVLALSHPEGPERQVAEAMRPPLTAGAGEPLAAIQARLERENVPAAVILERGRLAGIVSQEMLRQLAEMLEPGRG